MSKRPLLLDLFCGAGGAAMGYHRAGFDVLGVDIAPQKRYPFAFVQADALDFLAWLISSGDIAQFAAIHASPPCQEYSSSRHIRKATAPHIAARPMLIEPVYALLRGASLPWVLENVEQAPMPDSIVLCGSMFGLPIRRHRLFASSQLLFAPRDCQHTPGFYGIYQGHVNGKGSYATGGIYHDKAGRTRKREEHHPKAVGVAAMGIDWMTLHEMSEAIPPAYTHWIGRQLLPVVESEPAA